MARSISLPVSYNLLKPFPYSKFTSGLLVIVSTLIMLLIIGFTIYLLSKLSLHTLALFAVGIIFSLGLLKLSSHLINTYVRKTEVTGSIEVHPDHFVIHNKRLEYDKIGKMKVERYILRAKDSSLPYWKQCYLLEVETQNLRKESYLISVPYPNEGKPGIPDLFQALKHSSMEMNRKVEVY